MKSKYEFIMDEYNKVKAVAEANIGLDMHSAEFTKKTESIDMDVIAAEIERMFDAGRKVGRIFPNGNILSTIKNILTVKDYRQTVCSIYDYANSVELELVPRYHSEKIFIPEETGTVPLNARAVMTHLHSAFNQGLVSAYKKENYWAYFAMFSTDGVSKN